MSNISGSAVGWVDTKEANSITKKSNEVVSYIDVISELDKLHNMLKHKYETKPSKNVYDSLISVESAIKALLLN